MSFWTDVRDTVEGGAAVAGNYLLPGSGLVTSQLVSDGAKNMLNSGLGQIAMLGSGIGGGFAGNMSNYNSLGDMFNGGSAAPMVNPASDVNYQNGADLNNAAPAAAAPTVAPGTLSQGSNIDTTAGPINPAGSPNAGGAASLPDNIDVGGGYNPAAGGGGTATNPGFLASLQAGNYGDALSAAGSKIAANPIASIYGAGSLYDMYAKNQMAKKQQDLYNQNRADIMNMYAPGSPEYLAMKQQMDRQDAAAGRNSQYGTRAVDLAGKIAAYKTNAIANMQGGQNTLANQGLGNQFGMFNTPLTLAALTATQKTPGTP
jgi:hypothetical protein